MDSGDGRGRERDSIALIKANKSDNALNLARFLFCPRFAVSRQRAMNGQCRNLIPDLLDRIMQFVK